MRSLPAFVHIGLGLLLVGTLACANRGMEAPGHDAAVADGGRAGLGGLAGRAGGGAGASQPAGVAGQTGAAGRAGTGGMAGRAGTGGMAGRAGAAGTGGTAPGGAGAGGDAGSAGAAGSPVAGQAGQAGAMTSSGGAAGTAVGGAGAGGAATAGAGGSPAAGRGGGSAGTAGGGLGGVAGSAGTGPGGAGVAGAGVAGAGVAGSGVAGKGGAAAPTDAGTDGPTCAGRFNFEGGILHGARLNTGEQTAFTALANSSDAFCGGGALSLQTTLDTTNVKGEVIIPFAQPEDLKGKTLSIALKATPAGTAGPLAIVFLIPSYTVVTAYSPLPASWTKKTATIPSGADAGAGMTTGLGIQVIGRDDTYTGTVSVDEIDIR